MKKTLLTGRVAAENVPPELEKRVIAMAEKEMCSRSVVIRKALNEALPDDGREIDFFYKKALQR